MAKIARVCKKTGDAEVAQGAWNAYAGQIQISETDKGTIHMVADDTRKGKLTPGSYFPSSSVGPYVRNDVSCCVPRNAPFPSLHPPVI